MAGFTYLGVIFLILLLTLTAAAAGSVWQLVAQRERERELLFVGQQYRSAIEQYLARTPPGTARQLRQLGDLLRDPRLPANVRHLRRAYPDPVTGSPQWGLVRSRDGGIVGVYSLSARLPLKRVNFPDGLGWGSVRSYRDWRFIAPSGAALVPAEAAPAGDVPGTADLAAAASDAPPTAESPPPAIVPPTPRQQDFRRRDSDACARIAAYDRWQCAQQQLLFGPAAALECQDSANRRTAVCPFVNDGPLPPLFLRIK